MAHRGPRCDANRLKLLLQDGLPAEQQNEVVDHLDLCEDCQKALEGLAADDGWWTGLRELNRCRLPSGTKVPKGCSESQLGADFPLDFLLPAEDPEQLGRLGPFAITSVIGRGGMGVVLKGWDAALNRLVAIKILAPHFASN